jgi:hypothetical protein
LEVRPTFDGNPLSWLGSSGTVGAGFYSLLNTDYYSSNQLFQSLMKPMLRADPNITKTYVKVNRYENFQPPGNLWYHDHAMRATNNNVKQGLSGDYIIYDKNVEKQLPTGDYEILIVAGEDFGQNIKVNQTAPRLLVENHKGSAIPMV